MILYPAIDIRAGRCVRLVEGDFSRETVYDADPSVAARRWQAAGARWLHVVDLDGAVAGRPINGEAIASIRAAVHIPMQLGGGMRSIADVEAAFALGVNRVNLGTAALHEPALVSDAVARWNGDIAVALDARNGQLATDGWLGQTQISAVDAARRLADAGVRHFIVTDIGRDGTLAGPNLEFLREILRAVDADVIASGGIASLDDIRAAANVGAQGAIIGRALYDHRIDLAEAIAVTDLLESRL